MAANKRAELPTPYTDLAYCRQTLSGGSRSFWVASKLLPNTLRNDACALYAFCRVADDLIDEGDDADSALSQLTTRLDNIYRGAPADFMVDRALTRVVAEHSLPRELLDALLEGFAWDASGRRYETMADLYSYCARVAGSVGVMMSVLMDVRSPHALARAADLGVAMQLTNIARDIGEDARHGRLYLPLELLEQHGIEADALLEERRFSPLLVPVIKQLLDQADVLYERAESGIPALPRSARPGIYAARLLYAQIGHRLRELGYDSVSQRTVVDARGKAPVLFKALAWRRLNSNELQAEVLPQCAFLVNAVVATPCAEAAPGLGNNALQAYYRRMVWVLDLFASLENASGQTRLPGYAGHAEGQQPLNPGSGEAV